MEYNKQYIGIQLLMISIVVQCIDCDKYSCAIIWDCIMINLVMQYIGIHLHMINIVVQCNRIM